MRPSKNVIQTDALLTKKAPFRKVHMNREQRYAIARNNPKSPSTFDYDLDVPLERQLFETDARIQSLQAQKKALSRPKTTHERIIRASILFVVALWYILWVQVQHGSLVYEYKPHDVDEQEETIIETKEQMEQRIKQSRKDRMVEDPYTGIPYVYPVPF